MNEEKIGLICSTGGHLNLLERLEPWWKDYERFWVTFNKQDSRSILERERTYWAYHPTVRNVKNLIRNLFFAFKVLSKEKPDILISSGAGVAVPFFYVGKLFGSKLIFIEAFASIEKPTLTSQLIKPVVSEILLHWEEQKKFHPQGHLLGPLI